MLWNGDGCSECGYTKNSSMSWRIEPISGWFSDESRPYPNNYWRIELISGWLTNRAISGRTLTNRAHIRIEFVTLTNQVRIPIVLTQTENNQGTTFTHGILSQQDNLHPFYTFLLYFPSILLLSTSIFPLLPSLLFSNKFLFLVT